MITKTISIQYENDEQLPPTVISLNQAQLFNSSDSVLRKLIGKDEVQGWLNATKHLARKVF